LPKNLQKPLVFRQDCPHGKCWHSDYSEIGSGVLEGLPNRNRNLRVQRHAREVVEVWAWCANGEKDLGTTCFVKSWCTACIFWYSTEAVKLYMEYISLTVDKSFEKFVTRLGAMAPWICQN